MKNKLNLDVDVRIKGTGELLEPTVTIDHVVAAPHLTAHIKSGKTHENIYNYKIVNYLYGRLNLCNDSFFCEIVAYIHPDNPELLTYHLIYIDPSFYDSYLIDYSNTDFSVKDFFELS